MAGTPDLFVVCKKCGSEVSPYITECPYCGTRLRKRAPKIDRRTGDAAPRGARRMPRPTLTPLRTGEIPGIRGDAFGRPNATIAILALSLVGFVALAFVAKINVGLVALDGPAWRWVVAPFLYPNVWYQLAVLLAIGIYGWRVEVRHGAVLVGALVLACGSCATGRCSSSRCSSPAGSAATRSRSPPARTRSSSARPAPHWACSPPGR